MWTCAICGTALHASGIFCYATYDIVWHLIDSKIWVETSKSAEISCNTSKNVCNIRFILLRLYILFFCDVVCKCAAQANENLVNTVTVKSVLPPFKLLVVENRTLILNKNLLQGNKFYNPITLRGTIFKSIFLLSNWLKRNVRENSKFMPTAQGVSRQSPIQVLTMPNVV